MLDNENNNLLLVNDASSLLCARETRTTDFNF